MNHRPFPFHALGFRCNPFRALTVEERTELAVLPEAVERALGEGADHLQVLGPKGRGKTTALLALRARLRQEGRQTAYEHLPEGTRRFRTRLDGLDAFLLDEAQRLDRFQRARLRRATLRRLPRLRLMVGSHEDLARLFTGSRLRLRTVLLDRPDRDHLQAVLERRLAGFALACPPPASFSPEALDHLQAAFGSDLRAVEMLLYEVFQRLRPQGPITAETLRQVQQIPALSL